MKARVLDFNWLSDLEPGKSGKYDDPNDTAIRKFVRILAHTKNDSVFATQQVRILVDYLWNRYFYVILEQLFMPYLCFFLSFHLLVTWFTFKGIQSEEV